MDSVMALIALDMKKRDFIGTWGVVLEPGMSKGIIPDNELKNVTLLVCTDF